MSILDKYIDECQTFDEIAEWRGEYYKTEKKSGNDYTGILTNIYKEPTHFIYELLQNADDAKATTVKFVLSNEKIEFFHDGTREFSLSDIISITGVGNSSKESRDATTIGKFGVGFKAVFAVTDKPSIYSTTYNFQIENLSVPSKILERSLEGFTTIFQLDFKREGQTTLFRRNETLLRSMSSETILFLKNICNVEIVINNEQLPTISVSRSDTDQSFSRIAFRLQDQDVELLKFSHEGCSVVYQLREGAITPVAGSKISVFFPTIIDSNLAFLVDAPFQTSTTRESIDFELPYNKSIVDKFNGLFSESINKLKLLNLFTVEVFNEIMPIEAVEVSEDFPIYKTLQAAFQDVIKSKSFIPTNRNSLLSAPRILIADEPEVAELLNPIPSLNFAHRNLSASAIKFVKESGAEAFESVDLLGLINDDKINLSVQSDEWLFSLYEYCLKSMLEDSWIRYFSRLLKQTPLIRTRSGEFTAAFVNDSPNVFRPSKGIPDDRTIHPMFLTEAAAVSDETKSRMKSFLSELGITERKPVIVLKEDYFRDYADKTSDEKIEIFEAVANIYRQSEPKDKADIEIYLKNVPFIPTDTGEFKLAASLYDSYNTDLKYLLGSSHPELFCSSLISSNASYRELCLNLGLLDQLKVEAIVDRHSNRDDFIEIYELVGSSQDHGTSTKDYTKRNYGCSALAAILSGELSAGTTLHLNPLLQKILPDQLKETLEWSYYGSKKEVIGSSNLCKLLENSNWIARDDQMVKPADISFDDFCDLYKLPRNNVLQDLEWSNDDIIKQLSEKEQEAIKLMRELDLSPEEMHELRLATLEKRKKTERLGNKLSNPIEEKVDYEEVEDTAVEPELAQDEVPVTDSEEDAPLDASEVYEAADTHREQTVSTRIAAESDQSSVEHEEREVLQGLLDWYTGDGYTAEKQDDERDVYSLQKDGKSLKVMLLPKNQSGYNIEISENDKIIKTIAVIKADLGKKKFTISESQWNLSKRNDIQHSIYLVSRHGGSMSQIVIDDLRGRIREGSVRAVPGVIYYQ